jgi:hypothetical protein
MSPFLITDSLSASKSSTDQSEMMRARRRFSNIRSIRIAMNPQAPMTIRIIVIKSGKRSGWLAHDQLTPGKRGIAYNVGRTSTCTVGLRSLLRDCYTHSCR